MNSPPRPPKRSYPLWNRAKRRIANRYLRERRETRRTVGRFERIGWNTRCDVFGGRFCTDRDRPGEMLQHMTYEVIEKVTTVTVTTRRFVTNFPIATRWYVVLNDRPLHGQSRCRRLLNSKRDRLTEEHHEREHAREKSGESEHDANSIVLSACRQNRLDP